jgi:hypothetical protein
MIFQKNRNKLIEKAWDFEQDIIIEQIFEYALKNCTEFYFAKILRYLELSILSRYFSS